MPRDPSGLYTLPPGTDAVPNRTILSSPYNLSVHDIETDLNTPRPIIAGGTGASDATTALRNLGAMPVHGLGQCYLFTSGGVLGLIPQNGSALMINSVAEKVPDAGITLGAGGTTANTFYYIYAFMTGSTMTLERSSTGYVAQAGTGLKIKSADATRTLVGIWASGTAGTWAVGASVFNPKPKTFSASPGVGTIGSASTSFVEISPTARVSFVSFADREARFGFRLSCQQQVNAAAAEFDMFLDTSTPMWANLEGLASILHQPVTGASDWAFIVDEMHNPFTEAIHTLSTYYKTSTGTVFVQRFSNWVTILG